MKRQRGQSMVEFALIFPILILILMGLFDFGRLIVAYNTLSEAARNGARVAIVNQTPADICAVAATRAVAISLPTTCASTPTAEGIYVTASEGGSSCTQENVPCSQTVKATNQFRAITPIIGSFIGPITLSAQSTVQVENWCLNNSCPTT
jgi:Flp pilus assembly protein TadG